MASKRSNEAPELSGIDFRLLFPPADRRIGGDRSPPSEVRRFTFFKGLRTSSILQGDYRQRALLRNGKFSKKEIGMRRKKGKSLLFTVFLNSSPLKKSQVKNCFVDFPESQHKTGLVPNPSHVHAPGQPSVPWSLG